MQASVLQALDRFRQAEGFQALVDCAMELIGNPVVLFDMNEHVIASTNVQVDDERFTELQVQRRASSRLARDLDWLRNIRRLYTNPVAAFAEAHGLQMLTRGLLVNGVAVGHIHATAYFRPFTEDDLAVVDLIAPRLALELYQHLCIDTAQRSAIDTFLHYLLSGHTLSPEAVSVKASLLDWHLGRCLYVLCIDLFASSSDLNTVASSLLCGPDDRYTSFDNHAVIILSRGRPMDEEEFAEIEQYFLTLGAYCGMSGALGSIGSLAEGFEQAKAACEIGARVFAGQYLFRYDDCLPYVFIRRQAQSEDVLRYVLPGFVELAEEDKRTGGGLMRTLWLYLEHDRSVRAVAEALGVHKNTVTFRLGKLADALGLTLDGRDLRRLLHSITILEYVDRERFFGA